MFSEFKEFKFDYLSAVDKLRWMSVRWVQLKGVMQQKLFIMEYRFKIIKLRLKTLTKD